MEPTRVASAVRLPVTHRELVVRNRGQVRVLLADVTPVPANLLSICGVGPLVAAKILGEVRDVGRFSTAAAFASYSGTAPIPASSGTIIRHRLHRGATNLNDPLGGDGRARTR